MMNHPFENRGGNRRGGIRRKAGGCLRRLFALMLALLLTAQLSAQGFASEPGDEPNPTPAAEPVQSVTVAPGSETPLSSGSAVTNTYLLEISTGSVRGGSAVQNIKYFIIYYTDARGIKRSTVIFPQKDGVRKGVNAASAVANRDPRRIMVAKTFGYTTEHLRNYQALQAVSADQLMFNTPTPIRTVEKIQIFGRTETDSNGKIIDTTWSCQSMHISRVDQIYGLEMYGWYSGVPYIDYKGEVIADVVMADGGGIFHWDNKSAGIHTIKGPGESGAGGITLVNIDNAASFGKENFVGVEHGTQVNNRVVFRLDLADVRGGGFESLAGSYSAGARSKISDLYFCETAALRIRYMDIYGAIRELTLPIVMNSLGYAMEKLQGTSNGPNIAIAGFAQQGDTLVVSAMLPDFKELRWVLNDGSESKNVEIITGASKAVTAAKLKDYYANTTVRPRRVSQADKESFSYTCFAAYRNASVVVQHDSAALRYTVNSGAQDPFRYIAASSIDGVELDAGTTSKLSLLDYRENVKLEPADNRDLYLLTITTDNVQNAGTMEDVQLIFRYVDMRDKETSSSPFSLRDFVEQYYGEWPGNTTDFAYKYGFRTGGTIKMLIPLSGVKMFKTVSVKVGADEWQFKGIRVQQVTSYSPRTMRWKEIEEDLDGGEKLKSHLVIDRDVAARKTPVFEVGIIYEDPSTAPDPAQEGSGWTPGNLVQDDGQYHEYDGRNNEVSSSEPFDWSDYIYYMSYEDTLQDLGFTKTRCSYRVTVKVFGNKVNASDDDCGSANLFYFQLLFENGKSGCVLANQQLSADAFRTGAEAEFYIPATQDYGDLTAIRVIPDDQDSNSDIYDKLQIEWIKVEKQGTGTITPTWTADSDSAQGLGWVGIDYRDPGAAGSNRGTEGRTISEIAHTFEITKTSYSTKLLVAISTGEYNSEPRMNADGVYVPTNNPILEGGMSVLYSFYDHQGKKRDKGPMDVIHLMNEYSGLEDSYVRTIDGVSETMDFCVSNKSYQFRPGKTDKFIISVDDISKLLSMSLRIKSSVVTYWNIENVAVYLITGEGARYINGNGEYDYKYAEGSGLSLRCCWNRPQSLTKDIQIYLGPSQTSDPDDIFSDTGEATVNINFEDNDFPLGDDWTPRLTKEPLSKDDSLNLFIYPSTESAANSPSDYGLISEVLYTDTLHQTPMRINTGSMRLGTDSDGRPVFYALGLDTSYLDSIAGVEVRTNSVRPVHVPISYAVIQRVRSGVLIDSYYLTGAGNADLGLTLNIDPYSPFTQSIQHILLQVSQETLPQKLTAEENDLAVALYFSTDDPGGTEMRTKFIYLTDKGCTAIRPGEVLDLTMCIPNLKEIYGINLVSMGRLNLSFDNAEILEQSSTGIIANKWSFRGGMTPSRTPARFNCSGSVSLLDLDLKTAQSEGTINSGTNGPIRMTVGYLNGSGNLVTETFEDVRNYLGSTAPFQAGADDHLRLLIPDLSELRWVELEPKSEAGSELDASWKLESLSAMVDLSGFSVTKVLDRLILEGEPLRVSLADILIAGIISIITEPEEVGNLSGDYSIPTGGSLDLALNVGEGVRLVPKIQGSKSGVDVTLNRFDPTTGGLGRADLADTRGYTEALLEAYAQNAADQNHQEEFELWSSLSPDDGTWEVTETYDPLAERSDTESVVFLPPHNYTGSAMSYRITVTSRENPAAAVYVNLTVPPETNPVDQLLEEARTRDQANDESHEHNIQYVSPVAPTCSDDGNTGYYFCSGCGRYFDNAAGTREIDLASTVIPHLEHSFGPWQPNGSDGHIRTCNRCGENEQESSCSFGSWQPNGNGTHSRSCVSCGRTDTAACELRVWTDNGNGTHSRSCIHCQYKDPTTTEACTYSGWESDGAETHSRICSKCLHKDVQPHSFGEGEVTPPTTTEQGYTKYTCTDCGYSYYDDFTDPIPEPTEPTTEAVTEPPDVTDCLLPAELRYNRKESKDEV